MPTDVILLTGELEATHMASILLQHNSALVAHRAETLEELRVAYKETSGQARLIAFCTGIVVPGDILDGLTGPAYNFHPGPPTFPGSWASSFAIYERASRFGATLHVMERRVDEGAIIDVEWFNVPDDPKFRYDQLEVLAYQAALRLFSRYAHHMATNDDALSPGSETWSGVKRTKADAARLKEPPQDASEDEIRRRFRAFGS